MADEVVIYILFETLVVILVSGIILASLFAFVRWADRFFRGYEFDCEECGESFWCYNEEIECPNCVSMVIGVAIKRKIM